MIRDGVVVGQGCCRRRSSPARSAVRFSGAESPVIAVMNKTITLALVLVTSAAQPPATSALDTQYWFSSRLLHRG
jgi:hypothetical protein